MKKLFGTDGVRGIANRYPMTAQMAVRLGQAVAHHFKHRNRRTRILVGKDTRLSGYMFESALAAGITSMGADVMFVGPLPTPGIAFLTTDMRADAGIVISASHNAYQDNGIKLFAADGYKLPDAVELQLEKLALGGDGPDVLDQQLDPERIGRATRYEDATGRYNVFLKAAFPKNMTLDGLKIVVDCANGAAYKVAPTVLDELGAEVIALGNTPNGTNINNRCGSNNPNIAAARVLETGADLGITLDGDADRVILIDERGQRIDGDHIMALCAPWLKERDELPHDTVVATVMSNLGLEIALRRHGIALVRTKVGDRYVVGEMRKHDYALGGEQSGHLIFRDFASTGDGMVAALQVLGIMQSSGKRLSELTRVMQALPQTLINVGVASKPPLNSLDGVQAAIQATEQRLGDEGRVLVRYSGTENKARVMVEGSDPRLIQSCAEEIAGAFQKAIGA
ncbi:MAG: phosphoglucosamine mutase [Myxococcales bacterium]|nr:phosphoglucosamine mutase [Myxococcales bacterium]